MACGGGNPNKIGQSSWTGSNQWNLRRESETEEWNSIEHNIANNLEWQPQRKVPGNNNKNKRKSNSSKNSKVSEMEDGVEDFVNCDLQANQQQSANPNFQRTKFTMQNGLNGAKKKRPVYHEPNGEGDMSPSVNTRPQNKPPWTDFNDKWTLTHGFAPCFDPGKVNRGESGWGEGVRKDWGINEQRPCIKNISKHVDNDVNEPLGQLPNANQILERLMQIRDYMSQVAQMIETLQKSGDDRVVERLSKLQKVYTDLQNNEQQLVKLLDKISKSKKGEMVKFSKLFNHLESQENECLNELHQTLELQSMPIRSSLDGKSQSSADDSDDDDEDDEEDEFVDEDLNQDDANVQNQDSLQISRRNELLKKVTESQEKLKALQDQQASLVALQRKAENQLAQAKAMRHLENKPNLDEVTPVEMETATAAGLQVDLESLQGRLNALKDLYDNRHRAESMNRSAEPEMKMDESDLMTEMQRQELQDKLHDLQEKKRYMDNLLHELQTLQSFRSQEVVNNEMFSERIKEGVGATATAKQTLETAQDVLQLINPDDKMRKVSEMKARLKHLQEQIANYRPGDVQEMEESVENSIAIPAASSIEQLRNQNETRVVNRRPHKKDNLSREQIHEIKMDNRQGGDLDESLESENKESSELHSQFVKLQMAKDKLCKMQDMMNALKDKRQLTDDKIGFVHQLLLESLDKDDESQEAASDQFRENIPANSEENIPKERKRRSGFVLTPQEQQMNIDQLLEESHRLLDMEQFNINQTHPNNIDISLPSSKSFEQIRKTESREYAQARHLQTMKHNEEKEPTRPKQDHHNKKSSQKIKHNETEASNGDLVTSNQEIWSEVRQQFILKEELRQRKRQLEELMKKDKGKLNSRNQDNMSDNVSYSNKSDALGLSYLGTEGTTVATWGGSTQGNLDEDQEDQNSREDAEENEAYSSEEMVSAMNTPYTGRKEKRGGRMQDPSTAQAEAPQLSAGAERQAAGNVTAGPKGPVDFKDLRKGPLTRDSVRNWNTHSNLRRSECQNAEERDGLVNPSFRSDMNPQANWQQQTTQFMQQLEQTNVLHHSIMRDQSCLTNLLHQMSNLTGFPNSQSGDVIRPQVPELMQHITCQLQQQQQLVNLHQSHHLLYLQQLTLQQVQRQLLQLLEGDGTSQNITSELATLRCTNLQNTNYHPLIPPSWYSNNQIPPSSVATNGTEMGNNLFSANFLPPDQQTLNNQVAPGIRTNNYWDNFRSYSRQNLLSAASGNKMGSRDINAAAHHSGIMPGRHLIQQETTATTSADASFRSPDEANTSFHRQIIADNAVFHPICPTFQPKRESGSLPPKGKSKKDKTNENSKTDVKGVTRSLDLSRDFSLKNEMQKFCACSGVGNSTYQTNVASASSSGVSYDSPQEGQINSREGEDINERNLFETLRESIYSEVAVLISQNESRPHFLIRMFKELQKLNSDYLRQNALVSLTELISHLTSMDQVSPISPNCRRTWTEVVTNSSEVAASESIATSDEEEIRARLSKMNKQSRKLESTPPKSSKQKVPIHHYDYVETTESIDLVNTPSASLEHNFPSSLNESIANKSKELNQPKPFSLNNTSQTASYTLVEENISAEQKSEVNTSGMSCSELTSKQLDDKIQAIMLEVIPFLKAHLEDICSTKLLACLQQLVISLATLRDGDVEFTNVFRKRLMSALQAAHAKYTGKKLRDCGESLLVDTSEALVSELACVRLLQNVDSSSSSKNKSKNYRSLSENFSGKRSSTESSPKKENLFLSRGENASIASVDVEATDADECLANKMEEDELGHSRDDAMAANCDTFDNEDASRASSMNSFKDGLQSESDRVARMQEQMPLQEDPPEASASAGAKDCGGLKPDSCHHQNEVIFGEVDNETEENVEDNLDLAEADQPQNLIVLDRLISPSPENANELVSNEDATRAEDDQEQRNPSPLSAEVRGAEGGVEQGLDEVPIKLMPLFQRELNARREEEESSNNLIDEILNESVEAELAENATLRQPDSK